MSQKICKSFVTLVSVGYRAAMEEYRAVLDIEREVLGERHPSTLTTRHNLALVLRDQGREMPPPHAVCSDPLRPHPKRGSLRCLNTGRAPCVPRRCRPGRLNSQRY